MEQRPILLLAETGFIIRNLLLGTFADAVMKHHPLVVAVKNPNDESLLKMVKGKPLTLIPFLHEPFRPAPSRLHKLTKWHPYLRKLTNWNTYIYRFKQAEKSTKSVDITNRTYESINHSFKGKAGIQLLITMGHLLKRTGMTGAVEDRFLSAIRRRPITAQWREVLSYWKPAAVVSTMLTCSFKTRMSGDLAAVLAARDAKIPCGTLVQSWDNLSSKTAVLPTWLESYWTWSETQTQELLTLYPRISPERVEAVGSPQFDFHLRPDLIEPRESYMRRLGMDPSRPFILIGTGTPISLPNEQYTVVDLIHALRQSLPECQVLLRLHPKDYGSRWIDHRARLQALGTVIQETTPRVHMDDGGFVPPKEFYREQINCLGHAAAVVNTSSTLTVDAAILDRPIVCIGYDVVPDVRFPEGRSWAFSHSSHYAPLVATGGVPVVRSESECVQAVKRYLENPGLHRAGRQLIVKKVTGQMVGGAGDRLAEAVLALASDDLGVRDRRCG